MSELWKGAYLGVVVNLATAAVGRSFSLSLGGWLVTFGSVNELLGVLLVASPELIPRLVALGSFLRRNASSMLRRITGALRRLFHLPGRVFVDAATATLKLSGGGEGSVMTGPPFNATTEELVEYLLHENERHQQRLSEMEKELGKLPERWREDIEQARRELLEEQRELERRLAEARIHLRLMGLAYVVLGIALSWIGNLI